MKIRVICYSKKKKMENFCEIIANAQDCKWDKLPLAYPCDKERLTVFVVSAPHPDLLRMCGTMTKDRTANVAFLVDGKESSVRPYIEAVKEAGANVFDNIMYVKTGILPFIGGVSAEEAAAVEQWIAELVEKSK